MTVLSFSDVRDAVRGLRRAPTVAVAAVLCLVLGLGVTTAVFSAVDRALIQPPPYRDPGRVVTVYRTAPQSNTWPHSVPNYLFLAGQTRQLSALAAGASTHGLLTYDGRSVEPTAMRVTGNLFPMLGARALRGRLLIPADDSAGASDVLVLGETFWRQQLGGDPAIVGRTVRFQGRPFTVIGIVPRDFRFIQGGYSVAEDLWIPMRFTHQERAASSNFLMVMGRLAPRATVASAQRELVALHRRITETHPMQQGESIRVVPLQQEAVRNVHTPMLLIFGAVCMVLAIAIANVVSLLLARGVQRRREMAVRVALGAGRWAVMRPVLAESLTITVVGLAGGLALAWAAVRTLGTVAARQIPQLTGLTMNGRLLAFAAVLALAAAAACALVPAWRTESVNPQDALRGGRGGGAGREQHGLLGALVTAEVGLSLVLLIGASLVLRGFTRMLHADPGFDASTILAFDVRVSPMRYDGAVVVRQFLEPALDAVRALPGVAAAGAIQDLPYDRWGDNFNIRYEGQPAAHWSQLPLAELREATPGFFGATQQRLLAGRLFGPADQQPDAPYVVVANEALVKRDFKGRDPIGQRYYIGDTIFATIVGVVSDIKNSGPFEPPQPEVYYPFAKVNPGATGASVMVRVKSGNPAAVEAEVRAAVHKIDPGAAITHMRPMSDVIAESVGQPRFFLSLLEAFAAVALLLAVAGLYGVMSYSVAQRTREIGIRSALGSSTANIVASVVRRGGVIVASGLAVGLAGGAAATRLLRGLLYGVSPADPRAWTVAALAITLAAFAALLVPALRAARVDPLIAMRDE